MNIIYNLAFLLLFLFLSCNQASELPQAPPLADNQQKQKSDKAIAANIVFKSTDAANIVFRSTEAENIVFRSTDGGQTWQDISKGLPKPVKDDYGVGRSVFFADDNGLWLNAGNGIYNSKPNSTAPFWTKENFPDELRKFNIGILTMVDRLGNFLDHFGEFSIAPGKTGIYAYNYFGKILQKTNGTSVWSPVYTKFKYKRLSSIFETAGGTVFIRSENYGLFRSTNSGKTWKQVFTGGGVGNLVESTGVLMATSRKGIVRSTDDGENWALVISEGGIGVDVKRIEGGFAAITYSTQSKTRRVRTSYDGGKTWQPIDAGLPAQLSIASIIQVGENFFCGHPAGIFRSSDKGKTWKLLFPSIKDKVYNLFVSSNVIYAIPRNSGC